MRQTFVMMLVTLATVAMGVLSAQDKPATPGNMGPPAPALTREIELELELDDTKRKVLQLELDLDALRLELAGARGQVQQLLGEKASPAIERANAESRAANEKAVKALGGDPANGDTLERKTKTLKRGERKSEAHQ